ncbi:MAG: DRTGG domain-containing protein [Thermodesulfobacteriota bacterium]
MKLREVVEALGLQVRCGADRLDREVQGAYVSDLLSDVMARARAGSVWITLQTHLNVVAVAALNDLAGVILVNGRQPEETTLQKAEEEGVVVMISPEPSFEVAGKLYQMGLRGGHGPG